MMADHRTDPELLRDPFYVSAALVRFAADELNVDLVSAEVEPEVIERLGEKPYTALYWHRLHLAQRAT